MRRRQPLSRRPRAAAPAPRPAPVAAPVVAATPAPASAAVPARGRCSAPQDLKSIQGIDAATEARLNGLGVSRYEQIAAWTRADVDHISKALGKKGRIARENWIEQAQILARGGQTLFSVRRARGEGSTAAPTPDEGVPGLPVQPVRALPLPMSRVGVSAVVIRPGGCSSGAAAVGGRCPSGRPSRRRTTTCSASAASRPRSSRSCGRWGWHATRRSRAGRRPTWSASTRSSGSAALSRAATGSSRRTS